MSKDELYAGSAGDPRPFEFNESVARVFPDMLRRSIPGYGASIEAIGWLAARYVRAGTQCYDLGCSLGAATLAMRDGIAQPDCTIIAVDNAPAMVKRCRESIAEAPGRGVHVAVEETDVRSVAIERASMVVMNYTLQFLPLEERAPMMQKIADGLVEGGILVLSEKVIDEDESVDALLVDLHHEYKRRNAYSDLEISRKRAAIENVLVPESVAVHRARLKEAGFRHCGLLLRYYNFVSLVALK